MRAKHVAVPEFGAALRKLRTPSSHARPAPRTPAFLDVGQLRPAAAPPRTELEVARGCPESFDGRLRDECLNQHVFLDLDHATELIEAWVEDYNRIRPHGSLGGRTPEEFASEFASTRPAPPHGAEQTEPVP